MTIKYLDSKRISLLEADRALVQGFAGGDTANPVGNGSAGGGGGSGAIGATPTGNAGGAGGAGLSSSITGSAVTRAGGGGGGGNQGFGSGGSGGGGAGGFASGTQAGTGATGYGSGGGGGSNPGNGGSGYQGIVIIRFTTSGNGYSQAGGTVDSSTVSGQTIISWTSTSGTLTFTPTSTFDVQYLVLAGGGSGASYYWGGGGGAGGYLSGTDKEVTAQAYTIVVGAGGATQSTANTDGNNGSDSSALGLTAIGGGGGGTNAADGKDGGSGGGAGGGGGVVRGEGTSTDLTPTNVQDNSILVEKDTGRRYWFDAESNATVTKDYPMTTDPRTNTFNTSGVTTITHANSTLQLNQINSSSSMGASTYIDLGSDLSTKWVMRFRTNQSGYTNYAYNSQMQVGMSSVAPTSTSYNISSSLNWIGFRWYFGTQFSDANKTGIEPRIGQNTGDNTHNNSSAVDRLYGRPNNTTNTGTSYYHEYIWNVDTFTYNLYDNANYTGTKLATATMSASTNTQWVTGTPSSVSGLRYLVFKIGSDTNGGLWVNQLDDVKIYDGVTSVTTPATWTMEPTYETDFSSSTGWTQVGSTVSIGSGIASLLPTSGNNDRVYRSISFNTNGKFVMDYDVIINSENKSDSSSIVTTMLSNNSTGDLSDDTLMWGFAFRTSSPTINLFGKNYAGGSEDSTAEGTVEFNVATQYYARITRDGTSTTNSLASSSANRDAGVWLDSVTITMGAGVTNDMTRLVLGGRVSGTNSADIDVDNLSLYNGVTTIN
jgi:hypothetical protein